MDSGEVKTIDVSMNMELKLVCFLFYIWIVANGSLCYATGDNSQVLCSACGSELPGQHCTSQDIYAGHLGAFNCLLDKGNVAFVKHTTVRQALQTKKEYT